MVREDIIEQLRLCEDEIRFTPHTHTHTLVILSLWGISIDFNVDN